MRPSTRLFVFASAVLLLCNSLGGTFACAAEMTGTLTVHVEGIASDDGDLRFVLFDSKKTFLKQPVRAHIAEIQAGEGKWTIEKLPYGTYAVLVHHDIDASGKMERHWYGKPKEPTGASNNAPSKFGPPKFKDAKFLMESPALTLTITIQ